jgi:hypothetical protein
LVFAAPSALADEASYCVTCKNPDQTYRCRITGVGSRPNDALRLYCVIRTAKDGSHASCSAERNSSCNGVEKVYAYEGPPIPPDLASDPRVRHFLNQGDLNDDHKNQTVEENQTVEKPNKAAPKTLVELTGRAVSASRQGLRNARSALTGSAQPDDEALPEAQPKESRMQRASAAVGSFARKSYRCIFSLFRNCRDETTERPAPD